jgi:hypothetical protein
MAAQFVVVLFGPFGGAQQAFLLAVPDAINGALRLPALLAGAAKARASSISATAPETGSSAPFTQAS